MENPQLTTASKVNFLDNINLPDDWPVVIEGETGYSIGHHMSTVPVWGAERDVLIDQVSQGWSWEFIQTSESCDDVYKKVDGIIVSWPNEMPAGPKEKADKLRSIKNGLWDIINRAEYAEKKGKR